MAGKFRLIKTQKKDDNLLCVGLVFSLTPWAAGLLTGGWQEIRE